MVPTMRISLALVAVLAAACGDNVVPDPCEGVAGTCVPIPGGTSAERVDAIFNEAQDGEILAFGEGTFEFTTDLSLTANALTVMGQGTDRTILSFAGQTTGAQGILVTGNDFTARDFAIEDTVGDGLKLEGVGGALGVVIQN